MNILFFLKEKNDVVYVYEDDTIASVFSKLENNRYSAIPVLGSLDNYVGTLTEGDILWHFKLTGLKNYETTLVKDIKRNRDNLPIYYNEKMQSLLTRAVNENFVPVLDNKDRFIGIITRKEIIEYFLEHNFIVL